MQSELQLLNNFESDNSWLNANYEKLQVEFSNEFVAISNGKVVGAEKSVEKLVQILKSKGIDMISVLIEFIPKKGLKIII